MRQNEIFQMALGLAGTPWKVVEVNLDLTNTPGQLNIHVDYLPGSLLLEQEPGIARERPE